MKLTVPIRYVVLREFRKTGLLWFRESDFDLYPYSDCLPTPGTVLVLEDEAKGGPRGTYVVTSVSRWDDGAPVGRGRRKGMIFLRVEVQS